VTDLERQLTQLGREIDWPATPDLAPAVTARLRAAPAAGPDLLRSRLARPRARRRLPIGRPLVIALVALLVLAGGVFAAVPSVRDAVLEFFGLQGATVERREELPPPPKPRPLGLGERTTLSEVRKSLDFQPLVPSAAGEPDGVYLDDLIPGGQLTLTYRARPGLPEARSTHLGLLVDEFRGDIHPDYMGKIAGPATQISRVRIDGHRAIWIEGAPHFFFYRPPNSDFREDRLRIAQNVLLLEHGRVLVRLEGAFGFARARELARSLH
jgi:hypothetical protein